MALLVITPSGAMRTHNPIHEVSRRLGSLSAAAREACLLFIRRAERPTVGAHG
jgi:hypothetical protein